jgi:hypothetical protein
LPYALIGGTIADLETVNPNEAREYGDKEFHAAFFAASNRFTAISKQAIVVSRFISLALRSLIWSERAAQFGQGSLIGIVPL